MRYAVMGLLLALVGDLHGILNVEGFVKVSARDLFNREPINSYPAEFSVAIGNRSFQVIGDVEYATFPLTQSDWYSIPHRYGVGLRLHFIRGIYYFAEPQNFLPYTDYGITKILRLGMGTDDLLMGFDVFRYIARYHFMGQDDEYGTEDGLTSVALAFYIKFSLMSIGKNLHLMGGAEHILLRNEAPFNEIDPQVFIGIGLRL